MAEDRLPGARVGQLLIRHTDSVANQAGKMKELDSVDNEFFGGAAAAEAVEGQLNFFWHLTSRAGWSISQSDVAQIKEAHDRVSSAVDDVFGSMLETAIERRGNLSRYSDIAFVPVGEGCLSRTVLTRWGMKPPRKLGEPTGPFDLAIHPIPATVTLLESDFEGWLDPDQLHFSDEYDYVVNPGLRISFNHEVGEKYNEPGSFETIRAIYERRLESFRRVLEEAPTICFVLHVFLPSTEIWPEVRKLWDLLCARSPDADHMMLVLNTWKAGQTVDMAGREPIEGQSIGVLDLHYPFPEYKWWADFTTPTGYEFERELIAQARLYVDSQRDASRPD